jgi:hypothetical protein
MKTAFCTISTQSHQFKSLAMLESVKRHTHSDLFCLLTDGNASDVKMEGIHFQNLDALRGEHARNIVNKYDGNALRWACKPLYIHYLLNQGYDAVIYGDNDLFFYGSADFLFEKLKRSNVLLTPHFYPSDYATSQDQLEANFRIGLYNAGFIGANKNALSAMDWWAGCCSYNVKQCARRGLFDDQKYLDLFPILFDKVEVLKHRGCNVGAWNLWTSRRSQMDGHIYLADIYPLVFVHYNIFTIRSIAEGKDPLLAPLLKQYEQDLQRYRPEFRLMDELKSDKSYRRAKRRNFWWRWERRFE